MKRITIIFWIILLTAAFSFSQQTNNTTIHNVDSGYIQVNEGQLYYETVGTGENIVLIHDGLIHHNVWDNQFQLLANNYHVIRYDRRGYGKSSVPQEKFSNIDDLNKLFEQLKIDKAIIFGMSAGGGLTIDFTLKYPEKVSGIVLVGAVVSGMGATDHMLTRGGHLDPSLSPFADLHKWLMYFAKDDPYQTYNISADKREKLVTYVEESEPGVLNRLKYSFPPERPAIKYLSEIKIPALILVGEFDMPDVHAFAGAINAGITNSKRMIIPNSGHLIPIEQPEAFNTAVLKFLKNIEFYTVLNNQGTTAAIDYYKEKKAEDPGVNIFEEREMNTLGYKYMQEGKIIEAIDLFKLNTMAYPKSGNVYDSLGEAYLKNGQTELAIQNYEKSLELNPNNTNATQVLQTLKKSNE